MPAGKNVASMKNGILPKNVALARIHVSVNDTSVIQPTATDANWATSDQELERQVDEPMQ